MPVEWLAGTPFQDYFIPGLLLLTTVGIGSIIAIYGIVQHRQWAWWSAVIYSIVVIGFIAIQTILLQRIDIFQVAVYGGLGVAMVVLALLPSVRTDLKHHGS